MSNGTFVPMRMSDGATIRVYRALPQGERRGGLVVIQEIFGVNAHIRSVAEAFAAEGYEVLAPALFDREAPGFESGYAPDDIQKAIVIARQQHPFELSVADAQSCIDALKDKGKVFITGYCYGGSVTWAAACRCTGLAAASSYYGSQVPAMAGENPKCPTILHFGKNDHGIPLDGVQKVIEAHPEVPVYLYDAGHGFNCDLRPDYNPEAAKLARQRTLELFRKNGG